VSPGASDYLLAALLAALVADLVAAAFLPLRRHRWYRRRKGGHWECRLFGDVGQYEIWTRWPRCAAAKRLPWQHGSVACEDYPIKEGRA
jgi:hypothetical protein